MIQIGIKGLDCESNTMRDVFRSEAAILLQLAIMVRSIFKQN
jgi:hypothetical protein